MQPKSPKICVGMISYNDRKYLEVNLSAILEQDYPNFEVWVCDNYPSKEISKWIEQEYPQIKLVDAGGNVGFGRAHNLMMSQTDADYYLCYNSDMTIGKDYLSKLVRGFDLDPKIICVTGKLISWEDFPKKPAEIANPKIDTVGLRLLPGFQVIDKGQGELDKGQYEKTEEVFGASGASPMFKMEYMKDIQHQEGEYFDSNFFMYKEDIDLAFRMRWRGWKTYYIHDAVAWHDRTAKDIIGIWNKISERRQRPEYIKRNSLTNQFIASLKSYSPQLSLACRLQIRFFLFKYLLYIVFFDPKILGALKNYFKVRRESLYKAEHPPKTAPASEIEYWINK